jgi:hypothetical protein
MSDFLPKNPQDALDNMKNLLYDRLYDVKAALAVRVGDDEFDLGINCRLANEEVWINDLLDKIERS